MILIPAVDIKGGRVVRLTRGDFAKETVYSDSPEAVALKWEQEGAKMIHVVDLDGAASGRRKNLGSLKNICRAIKVPIQFGGGLRSIQAIDEVFSLGVSRAVIGTKVFDLKMLKQLVKKFGNKIVVSLDVRGDALQIGGWKSQVKLMKIDSLCKELEKLGVQNAIFTDVARDGTLLGPNFEKTEHLLKTTNLKIVVAGGISELKDLNKLKAMKYPNLFGVIIGKALYEKRFELPEALALVSEKA